MFVVQVNMIDRKCHQCVVTVFLFVLLCVVYCYKASLKNEVNLDARPS